MKQPLALLVPSDGESRPSELLQRPEIVPGGVESPTGTLSLDLVDYDDAGAITLSGRGTPNSRIFAYLDNAFLGDGAVTEDGRWVLRAGEPVSPGVYTLRIDEIINEKVAERLELPFSRAEPLLSLGGEDLVVVQPGNSLWRIARRKLGSGTAFTEIFEANKAQIRDPDLIYPGQIFQVPAGSSGTGSNATN